MLLINGYGEQPEKLITLLNKSSLLKTVVLERVVNKHFTIQAGFTEPGQKLMTDQEL